MLSAASVLAFLSGFPRGLIVVRLAECQSWLTSIRLELQAVYEAPANTNVNRHTLGVGEKVRFLHYPESASVTFSAVKGDVGDVFTYYDCFGGAVNESDKDRIYVCPIASNYLPRTTMTYGNATYSPNIHIVEPENVLTPEVDWYGCHSPGDVGQSMLVTTNYIGPLTVSFRGIRVAEVPCEEVIAPTGYFATSNFTGFRTHTTDAGAGYARRVQAGNRWTMDEAGGGLYPNWSSGRLEWKIPIGWFRIGPDENEIGFVDHAERVDSDDPGSRELLIGGSADAYKQVFTIDEDGTAKVE